MTAGMATIAGTMLALEASIIAAAVPNALGHLISCSIITLPAAVYIAHLLVPDDTVRSVAEKSFGVAVEGDTVLLPGVVSRKKQIIPNLQV